MTTKQKGETAKRENAELVELELPLNPIKNQQKEFSMNFRIFNIYVF